MSLTDYMVPCHKRVNTPTTSPLGGTVDNWTNGAAFNAGIWINNSAEMQAAYRTGVKTQYNIILPDGVTLDHNDRIIRDSDGVEFLINSQMSHTPAPAQLQYGRVTAEVIE